MKIFASKKFLIIVGIFSVLFIGIVIGGSIVLTTNPEHSRRIDNNFNLSNETALKNENDGNNLISVISNVVKVIRVIDGDTIEIEGGERIRYIGVDTPETVDPRKPVQCFGIEASNKNKELVEGKMARLEKDITDRDKYNRLLRYVWVGDTFVNLELIKQGFAYSSSYSPDIKYQDLFVKTQREAREMKRGLWDTCPVVAPIGIQVTVPPENNLGDSCLIKGNINASGENIYHLPGCGSYEKTKIDEARGEKWFCSESESQSAGWRKALNCP